MKMVSGVRAQNASSYPSQRQRRKPLPGLQQRIADFNMAFPPRMCGTVLSGERWASELRSLKIRPAVYFRHRYPPEIIRYCVWLYFRCSLSFLDIEPITTSSDVFTIVSGRPGRVRSVTYYKVLQHQARFGPSHVPLPDPSAVTLMRYEDIDSAAEARPPPSLHEAILLVLGSH